MTAYVEFLTNLSTSYLAPDASLVYVTTATEIRDATAIIKHIQSQQKQIEVKDWKVLDSIRGQDGLCLETEQTMQFTRGGGAYLPGMDENLLDEKRVTFALTHVVRFDAAGKITQIRMYWDQGTLLKQVEAIGKTGRNWPIKDGPAQIEAVRASIKAGGSSADVDGARPARAPTGPHEVVVGQHKKRDSVSATRDPHASLQLFRPRDPNEGTSTYDGPTTSPREAYKGPARGLDEILAGDERTRSPSPSKLDGFKPKAGAGKHHVSNRLFDENDPTGAPPSPERKKVFSEKNEHFEFGDGEDAPEPRQPAGKAGKKGHQSQIDFAAFSISPPVKGNTRPDYERNWGPEEASQVAHHTAHLSTNPSQDHEPPSPVKRPVVHAPRKDADTHFRIADESSPAPATKQKSLQRQKGLGLYQDPLQADERTKISSNNPSRKRDESHWDFGTPEKAIYKTAGNGMGGRRDAAMQWEFGDEGLEDVSGVRQTARGRQAREQAKAGAGAGEEF